MYKILHVFSVSMSIEPFIGSQISFFQEKGIEIHVSCSGKSTNGILNNSNAIFFPISISRKVNLFDDLVATIQLVRYIRQNTINLVVGHTPKAAFVAMLASRIAGVDRRIYFRHGYVFETAKGIKKYILLAVEKSTCYLSTEIISVSNSLVDISNKYGFSGKRSDSIVWNGSCNGINTDYFVPSYEKEKQRKQFSLPESGLLFGFVGRLAVDKGIVELVSAWKKLISKHSGIYLILAGVIDERDPISSEVLDEIQKENTIVWLGFVHDVKSLYQSLDILVLPSYREGLPLCNLEAASCEVPVITTNRTGCRDSVIHQETGLVTELDVASLEESMKVYIDNKALIEIHGKKGRKRIKDKFEQNKFMNELYKIYTDNYGKC